ncbi:hypothetical protein HAX54_036921 [Datura stramonium]|uniref:Uncharacterized protein n=1 Tax=Datura stramonium TaxID=4076 RepID=A0ABS8VLC8_DATST|nr:hypothetical protein [Datura stramonium]
MAGQRFPQSLKYDRLQCVFRNKMSISDPEDVVVITGRYPIITTLDMYVVVEHSPAIPEINDNEFDFGDNTYLLGWSFVDDEHVVNEEGEGHGAQNVNYHCIAIPYWTPLKKS